MEKKRYNTKQKEHIFAAIKRLGNGHITAEAIAAELKSTQLSIGAATVYRNLDKLVEEGILIRYSLPGAASACYQLLNGGKGENAPHSHAVCTKCGEITHLECDEIEEFATHLKNDHDFQLDRLNTVFCGICAECSAQL